MQDAFAAAVVSWRAEGIPANPAAWITATARRKLIDYARREQTRRNKEDQLLYEYASRSSATEEEMSRPFEDDRLSLIFTCCHPAINKEAQIALTLRTLGGLTTAEIARAFLLSEATLAQRLVRAQRKIQQARIPYQVPEARLCPNVFPRCKRFSISSSTKATRPAQGIVLCAASSVRKQFAWRARSTNSCRTTQKAWRFWRSCSCMTLAATPAPRRWATGASGGAGSFSLAPGSNRGRDRLG